VPREREKVVVTLGVMRLFSVLRGAASACGDFGDSTAVSRIIVPKSQFPLTEIDNLIDSKGIIVLSLCNVLGMEAATIEDDESIGLHVHELEKLPIIVPIIDVFILSLRKERVENHAVLKMLITILTLEELVAEFERISQIPNVLVWLDSHML